MDLTEKVSNLLSSKKNNVGGDYLLEIVCVQTELVMCETLFLEQYCKFKKTNNKELPDYTAYFIKDYLYRLYDLLEKISQLINNVLFLNKMKELRECSWDGIKKILINDPEYILFVNSIKKIDNYKYLLDERMNLTHRRIVKGTGSTFTSHILPLGGELSVDYEDWSHASWDKIRDYRKEIEVFLEQVFEEIVKRG